MSKITDFSFPSSVDSRRIHARQWLPDSEPYVGIVQLIHGVSEHIGRYDPFARFLNSQGYIVVGNDHLGHGLSVSCEEDRVFFADRDGWTHASNDTRTLQIMTRRSFPGLPYFLFGHSMGSFLARTYLIRFPGTVDGAVICGTGHMNDALIRAGRAVAAIEKKRLGSRGRSGLINKLSFGSYNRQFRPNRTDKDWLSANTDNVDAYIADPLSGVSASAGLFYDMLGGIAFIKDPANLAHMKKDTPVYFIAGGLDPVGENGEGVRRAYLSFKEAGMQDLDIRIYPGLRHEILNELAQEMVYADVLAWLERKRVNVQC